MKENCFDILFYVSWKAWKMIFCTPWNTIIFFSFVSFERNVTVQMKIRIISNHTWKHSKIILCFSLLFMISFSVLLTSWFMLYHFVFKETNKNKKQIKQMLVAWLVYTLDEWMAFVLSARSLMVNLETSKKKDCTVFCNTAKISKTMQHLIICERRLKVVRNRQFRSTTNAERITLTKDV